MCDKASPYDNIILPFMARWGLRRSWTPGLRLSIRLGLLVAAVFLANPLLVHGDNTWILSPDQTGDWSVGTNWSSGVRPTSGDRVRINNGGTANVTLSGEACDHLSLGDTAGTGHIDMTGGSLRVYNTYADIGDCGDGVFTQSAGVNRVQYLRLALGSGCNGTYNLSDTGQLQAGHEYIGGDATGAAVLAGTGTFNQTGGTNTIGGYLRIGCYYSGFTGIYNLSGGNLSAGAEYISYYGATGTFNQYGGVNTTDILHFYSKGTYNLNGGMLATHGMVAESTSPPTFNFGGGTLQATGNFTTDLSMNLTGDGGDADVDTAGYAMTFAGQLSGSSGLNKNGSGVLTLTGGNAYGGSTNVNTGVVSIASTSALPGWNTHDRYSVASGAVLAVGDAVTATNVGTMVGTGNFHAGSAIGFDVKASRAYDCSTLPSTIGLAKYGVGTLTTTGVLATTTESITVTDGSLDLGAFTHQTSGGIHVWGGTVQNGTLKKNSGSFDAQAGTICAVLADGPNAAGLAKTTTATMTLAGGNTYTGPTNIYAGVLRIQNGRGTGTTAGGVTVGSGAALELQHTTGITVGAEALSLSGTGVSGNGALRNISGNNTWGGTITLQTATTIQSDAGNLTLDAPTCIAGSNRDLTLEGAGNGIISGTITTGNGTLTKNDTGTWTLSGGNTYSGLTAVNRGTLNVANSTGSATGSGAVTVMSGARLSGSGSIAGPVTVKGILSPGDDLGMLTVNNQVTFQAGSTFDVEIMGLVAGSGYDQLRTTGPVSLAGSLTADFGSFTPTGHDVLFVLDNTGVGATTGTFQYADNAKIGRFNGRDWYITYDANNAAVPSLNGGNDVAIYTVPEPGSLLLLGIGAVGLVGYAWRRNRTSCA